MPTLRPTKPSRNAAGVEVVDWVDIVFSVPDCDWPGLKMALRQNVVGSAVVQQTKVIASATLASDAST